MKVVKNEMTIKIMNVDKMTVVKMSVDKMTA